MKKTICLTAVAKLGIMLMLSMIYVNALAVEEKKITIDQVPKKVKAAILKEAGEGKIIDIGKITKGGKTFYEIELISNNKEIDILFSSEGKVLKMKFEGIKSEKSESGEKGHHEGQENDDDSQPGKKFQEFFNLENRNLCATGKNKFFILQPGYQLVLEGKKGKEKVKLIITVLNETKKVEGVETRIVEEISTVDGELTEISRNFFAICKDTKNIFYFGEEVDIYKKGKIIGHEGAWIAGRNNARAGMMMPGVTVLGARHYQEMAPKVAMDRVEIIEVNKTLATPVGIFQGCLKVEETNPVEPGEKEYKIYAPGIGLVKDANQILVKYGFVKK